MRTLLVFLFCLLSAGSAFAFDDPFMRLHINQRNYINPGAVCPFCKGSCFLSYGIRHQQGEYNHGYTAQYAAFGNDARNQVHGPWDFSYMNYHSATADANAFSARYAYAFQLGEWRAGIGVRASYYLLKETREIMKMNPPVPSITVDTARFKGSQFDGDLGTMVTNLHGTYFGFSVRHLASPAYVLQSEMVTKKELGSLPRSYHVMAGTKIAIGEHFDISPEATFQHNGEKGIFDGGAMFRYNYRWTVGLGYSTDPDSPHLAIRAGFTHSKFKWIAAFEPSPGNFAVETGIIWRFLFQQECIAGPPQPHLTDWEWGSRF